VQMCSHTSSNGKSNTVNLAGIIQVDVTDVVVDDVIA
jgi:hypothetical protein